MAIFVGSDNNDSKIRDNRVGLAISTSNPSSPDTGDAYYNSTDNKLTVYNGSDWASAGGGGTIDMVASGTLSNGQTVIVSSDGAVVGVSSTGSPQALGTKVVFESAHIISTAAVFDSTNNKVVVAYCDIGNSDHGTAVVGTVSGNSISFGTPVVFNSAATYHISATFDSTNSKVVIAYTDNGNLNYGTAIVGTVSGTSISFGSATVFNSGLTYYNSMGYDSTNGKVVIAYRDGGGSNFGNSIVGTVSGTSISFGSESQFENSAISNSSVTFDSTNNKIVIAYRNDGNSDYGTAVVGTVSGTSISYGTPVVFESAAINSQTPAAAYDSNSGKVIISYGDQANSEYGTAIVGTVSGTSINFGTAVVFESAVSRFFNTVIDSTNNKVVVVYQDASDSEKATLIVGTVSGTSISFESPIIINSPNTNWISATFDSNSSRIVTAYQDYDNSQYGTAIVFKNQGTNLTATNFIGFSDAAYTDGQTAKIQIEGSVDDAQTGLTTAKVHYVQTDGSLSTTAGNPSVSAGIAITDTKIIVKG